MCLFKRHVEGLVAKRGRSEWVSHHDRSKSILYVHRDDDGITWWGGDKHTHTIHTMHTKTGTHPLAISSRVKNPSLFSLNSLKYLLEPPACTLILCRHIIRAFKFSGKLASPDGGALTSVGLRPDVRALSDINKPVVVVVVVVYVCVFLERVNWPTCGNYQEGGVHVHVFVIVCMYMYVYCACVCVCMCVNI